MRQAVMPLTSLAVVEPVCVCVYRSDSIGWNGARSIYDWLLQISRAGNELNSSQLNSRRSKSLRGSKARVSSVASCPWRN